MEHEYRIGERVMIYPELRDWDDCESGLTKGMKELSGQVVTIDEFCDFGSYRIKEDNGRWVWSVDCFAGSFSGMSCTSLL